MARGLLNGQSQPGAASPPAATPLASGEESSNVTPEEQAQYNAFVVNGMQLMYSEQTMPQLLETLKGGGSPTEGLANALATLVMRLEDSAGQAGTEISGDVKLHAAGELMSQLVELSEQAGLHSFSEEEVESALYLALDIYRTTRQQEGRLPEDELKQDMQTLLQAEQQGQLENILPGIREYAAKAPKGEPPAGPPAGGRRGLLRG